MRLRSLVLGLALIAVAIGCGSEKTLPEELVGTYTTSARRYAGRSLELTRTEIGFGLGEVGVSRYPIESVSREQEQGKTLYTLAYAGDGGTSRLRFFHDAARGGSIVLRNQSSIIWTRQEAER